VFENYKGTNYLSQNLRRQLIEISTALLHWLYKTRFDWN